VLLAGDPTAVVQQDVLTPFYSVIK